jgi:diaminohydroxyphosphoribosylaminopyrimidine deaminase/5-amino-6-(5-phosphoribosylamino)uracil reductase
VTLEPCSHQGKTGPCSGALIQAGVIRVVVALADPNPLVLGAGLEQLRAAGIAVECGLLESEARSVIPGFIARMSRGRGRVRAKLAMSLDGRTAVGTVLADDCALTVRPQELGLSREATRLASGRQPMRVVLDSRLQTPATAKVLDGAAPTLLCHDATVAVPAAIVASAVGRLALPCGDRGLDLQVLMKYLAAQQYNEILVESGPRLAGALLQAGLLDELIVYMAPALLGDRARPLLALPLDKMADKVQLQWEDVRKVGTDWCFTAIPVRSS